MLKSWFITAIIFFVIFFGFVFHTSGEQEFLILDKYTPRYFAFLVLLGLMFSGILFFGIQNQEAFSSVFKSTLISGLVFIGLAVVLFPSIYIYSHQNYLEKHIFTKLRKDAHAFWQIDMAPDLNLESDRDAFKILAIGGSTTYGSKLERHQAYPAILEKLLREKYPEKNIRVFNAGSPWHTSLHSLLRYISYYANWKPDMVIIMHAFNDVYQSSEGNLTSGKYKSDYGHFFGALGHRVNPKDKFANTISRVLTNNLLARIWYSDFREQQSLKKKIKANLITSIDTYKRNMQNLVFRIQQDGAIPVVMTQPFMYKTKMAEDVKKSLFYQYYYQEYQIIPTIKEQEMAMRTFNQATLNIASQYQVNYVDLEQLIKKEPIFMYDDVHYTKLGAQIVAEQIVKKLPWDNLLEQ